MMGNTARIRLIAMHVQCTSSEFSVYSLQNTNYKIVAHLEEVESEDKSNTRRRKTKRRLRLGHLGRHP